MARPAVVQNSLDVTQCHILFTVEDAKAASSQNSDEFTFRSGICYLELTWERSVHSLYLRSAEEEVPVPFDVVVYMSRSAYFVTYRRRSVTDASEAIWSVSDDEFRHNLRDFRRNRSLFFKVWLYKDSQSYHDQVNTAEGSVEMSSYLDEYFHLNVLSRDFSKLFTEIETQNVRLECGDSTFRAHRVVLGARSKVLYAMLETDMLEAKTGLVKVEDVEEDVFRDLLRYVYTGTLPVLTLSSAKKLYEAADKYDMEVLRKGCWLSLIEELDPSNAQEILDLADRHSDNEFKARVEEYMSR